jgi:predicted transposase YdaD
VILGGCDGAMLAPVASLMTTRPHDAFFKSVFETPEAAAALLRELLPPSLSGAIAWETVEAETGSFVDAALADRHSDLLFSARLRAGGSALLYFLLEHQSHGDPSMPLRTLAYQNRIWDRFRREQPGAPLPPVIAVVVCHVRGGWTHARAIEELFDRDVLAIPGVAPLVPRCEMIVEDLAHRSNDELKARALAAVPKVALWLLRDARDPVRLLSNFDVWRSAMIQAGQSRSGIALLITYMFRVVDPMYLDELRAKLYELGSSGEEATMTIADYLEEQGWKKGVKEGRIEGIKEGRIEALRRQLLYKFKTLDEGYEARLQAATMEALDRYLQRVLTADSLAAVFED